MGRMSRGMRGVAAAGTVLLLVLPATPGRADPADPTGGGKPELLPATGPASDDPVPAGFASWDEVMSAQQALNAIATRVRGATAAASGFAGVSDAVDERRVVLHWQGPPSDDVLAVVAREHGTVTIEPAAYSARQLREATDRVFAAAAGQPALRVGSVVPLADGSGIRVGATGDLDAAKDLVHRAAGVEATVASGDAVPVSLPSRLRDIAPFYAGAFWQHTGGEIFCPDGHSLCTDPYVQCTTGFGVHWTAVDTDLDGHVIPSQTFLLGASHCAREGYTTYDFDWKPTGDVRQSWSIDRYEDPHDMMLIAGDSIQPSGDRMYIGPYASVASVHVAPTPMISFPGEYVCASGALSGSTCHSKVVSVDGFVNHVGHLVGPVVTAEQVSHTAAVGGGDSGAPVYFDGASATAAPAAPPGSVKTAIGSVSSYDPATEALCKGVLGRGCGWRWYYIDIAPVLDVWQMALN